MTSAQIIASIPMWPDFSVREVNRLCREGKLYGYKVREGKFEPWIIPEASFALYLKYNPIFFTAFRNMNLDHERRDSEILKFAENVSKFLKRDFSEETYTAEQLSHIFGAPRNQILAWFTTPKLLRLVFGGSNVISIDQIVKFLEENPKRLEALNERHKMLLAKGDAEESAVRHLLMLYSYYKTNHYLI